MPNICNFSPIKLSEKSLNERLRFVQKNVCSALTTAQEMASNFVSVTSFGVVGDGVTDDTVALQAAFNSGNPVLWFPPGTYNITTSIKVNSNTTVFGYGATLFKAASIDNMMINNSDGITGGYAANENIEIYGLRFNGNRNGFALGGTLLAFGHASNIKIIHCHFYNIPTFHGIEMNAVQNAIVEGCTFYDGGSELLQLDLAGGTGLFPWFGPFDLTPCTNVIVSGNLFRDGGAGVGSHSGQDPDQHTDIAIVGNAFKNLTGDAIRMWNYRNLVINGNVIDGCAAGVAAFVVGPTLTQNWNISSNTISNATDGGLNVFNVKGLSITGNSINGGTKWGIFVGNADNVTITGNTIRDVAQSTTTNYAAIDIAACTNVYCANNVATKSSAGLASSTNTIKTSTSPFGGSINTNITIENNTVTTPAATTTLNFSGTNTNFMIGMNVINGTITPYVSTKTANYTYTTSDAVINVDTTAGNVTITINPTIFNKAGLRVKKTSADGNSVIISTSSGTINGGASISLTAQNQVALITSDWTNLDAAILT